MEWEKVAQENATLDSELVRRFPFLTSPLQAVTTKKEQSEIKLEAEKSTAAFKAEQAFRKRSEKEFEEIYRGMCRTCEDTKKLYNSDLECIEKTVRSMRRSRRHFKAKRIMELQKEELNFEDLISSSDDNCDDVTPYSVDHTATKTPLPADVENITTEENADSCAEEEGCNFPRLALGGVPIMENGEPLGATHSEEWVSEYGGTSSQVRVSMCKTGIRKVQSF